MARDPLRERLQPSLLDRLTDDDPKQPDDPPDASFMGRAGLHASVLRDLGHLLNATRLDASQPLKAWPQVENSVLNYGLPALVGSSAAALDARTLEQSIQAAILRHEPRFIADTLVVRTVARDGAAGWHKLIRLEISGQIRAHPLPLEMLLRTELDLETGRVALTELTGAKQRGWAHG